MTYNYASATLIIHNSLSSSHSKRRFSQKNSIFKKQLSLKTIASGKVPYHVGSKKTHCVKSVQIRSFLVGIFVYSVRIQENTDQQKLHILTLLTQWPSIKTPWLDSKSSFSIFTFIKYFMSFWVIIVLVERTSILSPA